MPWLAVISLLVVASIAAAFHYYRRIKMAQRIEDQKETAIRAATRYAIAHYTNLFWAMVMGIRPCEESELGYLAREFQEVMKKLPKDHDIDIVKRQAFLLGLNLWRGYQTKRATNPGYPCIFNSPGSYYTSSEVALQGDLDDIVGEHAFESSGYTRSVDDRSPVEGRGWIFSTRFLHKLLRLKQRGISTVLVPIPSLGEYHHLLEQAELPEIYIQLTQRVTVPYVPDLRAAVKQIDRLLASEKQGLITEAKKLQDRLNEVVTAGLAAEIPLAAFADHSFEARPLDDRRHDPEVAVFLVECAEEEVKFFQSVTQ